METKFANTQKLNTNTKGSYCNPKFNTDILFNFFHEMYGIDIAAIHNNPEMQNESIEDFLEFPLETVCWVEPPTGSSISKWVHHAYLSAHMYGGIVIMLLPARTDAKWWHDYIKHADVYFIQGRMRLGYDNSQPVPCAVVVFRPDILTNKSSTMYLSLEDLT